MRPSKAKLLDRLGMNADDRRVRQYVVEYCRAHRQDPYDDLLTPDSFNGGANDPIYLAWSAPAVREWFAEKLPPVTASVWASPKSMEFQNAAVAVLGGDLVLTDEPPRLYLITDGYHEEVVRAPDDPSARVDLVNRLLTPALAAQDVPCDGRLAKLALDKFLAGAPFKRVAVLGQVGQPGYCLHRAKIAPDASVPFPLMRQFTDRLNDGVAFAALIAGWYYGKLDGARQSLYISDPWGDGGKSAILRVMTTDLFGLRISSALNPNILKDSSHASAMFRDKKLVVAADNNNPAILLSTLVKELTGDDATTVNPKFKEAYSTSFECHIVVLSNVPPLILSARHSTSRVLWLTLEPLPADIVRDPGYAAKCAAELPGFLAWGLACLAERCHDGYHIEENAAVQEAKALRINQTEEKFAVPFLDLFTLDKAGTLSGGDWVKAVKDLRLNEYDLDRFKTWIAQNYPQVTLKKVGRGYQFSGLRLKAARDRYGGGDDDTVVPA